MKMDAIGGLASTPLVCVSSGPSRSENVSHKKSNCAKACEEGVVRRSGNYKPSIWHHDYIQSLTSVYVGEDCRQRLEQLKEKVRMIVVDEALDELERLEFVDVLERLGLSYHFKDEITRILESIYFNSTRNIGKWKKGNLYATALEFRILRQHGFLIPQDVFGGFMDDIRKCKASPAGCDTKEMLCLYEASYMSTHGEDMLMEAQEVTTKYLKENLMHNNIVDPNLGEQVKLALELPNQWRTPRFETRWFIDIYEGRLDKNPLLLEFAKLDFNMVQAIHLEDLKHAASWWANTRIAEKLSFARDRLVECFFWTLCSHYEPQLGRGRKMGTKVNAFITVIDDIYDVYGTIEELELFTDAVERWDMEAAEQLPDYMKMCYLNLYNSINEMAYDVHEKKGSCVIPCLKKMWAEQCKAQLTEAKWLHNGYMPTLAQYLDNACVSIGLPTILVHYYFLVTKPITDETFQCLERYESIFRRASMLLRLTDDLGTYADEMKKGDTIKSIQCYMQEKNVSEKEARDYIKYIIGETWKEVNKARFSIISLLPTSETTSMIDYIINSARSGHFIYQHGDGFAGEGIEVKKYIVSMLLEPIPLVY